MTISITSLGSRAHCGGGRAGEITVPPLWCDLTQMTRIQVLLTGSHLPWWEPLCKSPSTLRAVMWVIWISGRYLGGIWGAGSQLGLWSWGSISRDVGGGGEWLEEEYLFWRVLLLHFVPKSSLIISYLSFLILASFSCFVSLF